MKKTLRLMTAIALISTAAMAESLVCKSMYYDKGEGWTLIESNPLYEAIEYTPNTITMNDDVYKYTETVEKERIYVKDNIMLSIAINKIRGLRLMGLFDLNVNQGIAFECLPNTPI